MPKEFTQQMHLDEIKVKASYLNHGWDSDEEPHMADLEIVQHDRNTLLYIEDEISRISIANYNPMLLPLTLKLADKLIDIIADKYNIDL